MKPITIAVVIVAMLVGVLAGHLWWGRPDVSLEGQLRDARASADQFGQEVQTLRADYQKLKAQLDNERTMNQRLHQVIAEGRK
jgi:hypothetical protein